MFQLLISLIGAIVPICVVHRPINATTTPAREETRCAPACMAVGARREKKLILFLAVLCGGATVVAFMASTHAAVAASWTSQLCRATSPLCHSPVTLGLATAGLVSLWIFAALLSMFDSA